MLDELIKRNYLLTIISHFCFSFTWLFPLLFLLLSYWSNFLKGIAPSYPYTRIYISLAVQLVQEKEREIHFLGFSFGERAAWLAYNTKIQLSICFSACAYLQLKRANSKKRIRPTLFFSKIYLKKLRLFCKRSLSLLGFI